MTQSAKYRSSELWPGDVRRDGRYEIQQLLRAACDKSIYLAQDRVLAVRLLWMLSPTTARLCLAGLP